MSQSHNPNGEQHEPRPPANELEVYDEIIQPGADDEFIGETNFGTGNYTRSEQYSQLAEYETAQYAATFQRLLERRAIAETKRDLALRGTTEFALTNGQVRDFSAWEDETQSRWDSKRDFIEDRGDDIWDALSAPGTDISDKQREAVKDVTGYDPRNPWEPPSIRRAKMFHDLSKSKESRLSDNVFRRVTKRIIDQARDAESGMLSKFRNGGRR